MKIIRGFRQKSPGEWIPFEDNVGVVEYTRHLYFSLVTVASYYRSIIREKITDLTEQFYD